MCDVSLWCVFTLSKRILCKIFCKICHASIQTPTNIRFGGRFDFFSTHYFVISFALVRCLACVRRQLHPTHLIYQLILLFEYTGLRCNVSHQCEYVFAYFHFMWVAYWIHVFVPTMRWCTDEVIWNCDRRSSEEKATYIFTLSSSIVSVRRNVGIHTLLIELSSIINYVASTLMESRESSGR